MAGGQTNGVEKDVSDHDRRVHCLPLGRKKEDHTSEVVTTNVVHLSVLDKTPDLGLLQVIETIVVRRTQIGAHAPVVSSDDHTAPSRRLGRLDAVLDTQTGLLDGILEDGGVLVIANTSQIHDAVFGQDVLGTTGGVLGGAARDQLRLEVVEQVFVDTLVAVLGQDGVIGLEAVLGKELLVAKGLDVCCGGKGAAVSKCSDSLGRDRELCNAWDNIPRRGFSRHRRR